MTVVISGDTGIDAVQDNTIQTSDIADGQITEAKLSAGAGSADQILTSNGSGTLAWANAAAGGFSNMEVFTSTGTWTNPGSVTKVKVTVTGGGGGGATNQGSGFAQAGGGGGTAIEVVTIPTAPVSITVGAGGTEGIHGPGNTGLENGSSGGTSSFGAYCSATGGSGGVGCDPGGNNNYTLQHSDNGGSGSGGTINIRGGVGATATQLSTGGSSIYGSGGQSIRYPADAPIQPLFNNILPGKAYGAGGGKAEYTTTTSTPTFRGGSGAAGIVIVEY
jgi:hypothetical protein